MSNFDLLSHSPSAGVPASTHPIPLAMLPDEARIWSLIAPHSGRHSAISAQDLSLYSGLSNRLVRRVIKRLIEIHATPIASTPTPPAGYYIPETLDEVLATTESLKSRALSILTRMARLRRVALPEVLHQLHIEITPAARPHASSVGGYR